MCEGGVTEAEGRVNVLDVPSKPRSLGATEIRSGMLLLLLPKHEAVYDLVVRSGVPM